MPSKKKGGISINVFILVSPIAESSGPWEAKETSAAMRIVELLFQLQCLRIRNRYSLFCNRYHRILPPTKSRGQAETVFCHIARATPGLSSAVFHHIDAFSNEMPSGQTKTFDTYFVSRHCPSLCRTDVHPSPCAANVPKIVFWGRPVASV